MTSQTERSGEGRHEPDAAARTQRIGLGVVILSGVLALLAGLAWSEFERQVGEAFDEARAQAPTRLYSRPLVLRVGDRPDREFVEAHLRAAGYRLSEAGEGSAGAPEGPEGEIPEAAAAGTYRLAPGEWSISRRPVRIGRSFLPAGTREARLDREGRLVGARDVHGDPVEELELEPVLLATLLGDEGRDRIPVGLEEVPAHLIHAVLVAEDRRFFRHRGLDLRRTVAALYANLRAGRVEQGGSTLTQQLARTLFLDRSRTLTRKVKEAVLATALERRASKRQILEAYLNHVYLGHVGGVSIHGAGRAAEAYFGRDLTELEPHESALLAAMVRAPNLYSPYQDEAAARARRDQALERMREAGYLAEEAAAAALSAPIRVRPPEREPRFAPYFADLVEAELRRGLDGLDPGRAGLTVMTTLVPGLQDAAERSVRDGLAELERSYPYQLAGEEPLQASLVALDPRTGDVVSLVGGRDYQASQFNRAAAARRQPGSVFKPVVILAALTSALGPETAHTLASTFRDEPITVDTDEGPWSPANYDGLFRGPVSLRLALVASRNLPFVRLGLDLGPTPIVATARTLGIRTPLRPVPSLALGSSEVTLLEMTAAYGVLAAEGLRAEPRTIAELQSAGGPEDRGADEPVGWAGAPAVERAFAAEPVRQLTSALEAVVQSGTGRGVRERGYRGPLAAKSGTTDDYRDAWFVGYTTDLTLGVWVGFDSGASLGIPGNVAALPIFTDFLRAAVEPNGRAALPLAGSAIGFP